MYTIYESINEIDELENIIKKIPFTKNRNINTQNKLSRNKSETFSSRNKINPKNNKSNNFYNFTLSCKDWNITKSNNQNDTTRDNINFNNFKPGNLLFEIFINLSEFDMNKFDFFVNYTNICTLLREINIIDKKLYTGVIISQNDIDIILKTIKKNNKTKKLNFKEFMKFFSHLVHKIDFWHFVDDPKRTLKFNINKFFGNYFKGNKTSFISLIYNYVLYVQQEKNINEIMNPIISYINNIYIKFYEDEAESNKENEYISDNNNSISTYKSKFRVILNIMKNIGVYHFFVNLKELVIIYYIELDDNNDNEYLYIGELNSDFDISFKKFCQFFFCLCLYIKIKKESILKQYLYLLDNKNTKFDFENELKFGQKEGIIRFILTLDTDIKFQSNEETNKEKILENKFNKEIEKIKLKDINFLYQIYESYSSHFDKYLNYQISFSDILIFLKQSNLIDNNYNKIQNLSLEQKYNKAKKRINRNISTLKNSLHSLDYLFKGINKENENENIYTIRNQNNMSLRDVEIFFCKASQRANINNRLNFKEFLKFLYLSLDKMGFNSIEGLIEYLNSRKTNNLISLIKQNEELKKINEIYNDLKSNEIINIIHQISPIINAYLISFANKNNIYTLTYDIFVKIFIEFDMYPNIVGNTILRNIFYELYQIKINKSNRKNYEEKKEIGFDDIFTALGIITLILKDSSDFDEKKLLIGLFYMIAKSKKIKLELNLNFNFSDNLKNKLIEISKLYFDSGNLEEPEYIAFLKNPFL